MHEERSGERLDVALAQLASVARSQARRWIDAGRVTLNGELARASARVEAGDEIEAEPPDPSAAAPEPEAIELCILYEDSDLIVLDKAAGMVVHPAPGHPSGTLVNALLHHCRDLAGVGGVLRPGIVHRLDRGTSGVMVVAKHDASHRGLAEQFRDHTIERLYRAFARALPGADEGEMDRPIGRHPRDRKRMSVAAKVARAACTRWRVQTRYRASGCTLLEIRPRTGRTHQIRVHLSAAGMPILGDPVYGRARALSGAPPLDRPALHAAVLAFEHPSSGKRLHFEAPLPPDLTALREWLERREAST